MARRRRRKNPLNVDMPRLNLEPETKRGIFIVFIFACGGIGLLSLFGLAGTLGVYSAKGMILLLGWGKWLLPLILLVFGFLLYNEDKYWVRGANYLGAFLFVLSLTALFHLFIDESKWSETITLGQGGGYLGLATTSVLNNIMGFWATLIVVICLLLVSVMLMFNAKLESILGKDSWFAKVIYPINFLLNKLFRRSEEDYEIIEEDEEEEQTAEELVEEDNVLVEDGADSDFKKHSITTPAFFNTAKDKKVEKAEKSWKPSHIKIDLPLDLLNGRVGKPTSGDIKNNILVIQKTLENFGIPVEMGEVSVGPTVTQYTLKPAEGVKLSRITTLSNDLALSLAAHPIRIEAPIPGKSFVGIEVPNQTKAVVGLREILSDSSFNERKTNIMIAIGKDVSGKAWLDDLSKMPHLLVAGATNSGKSVCLNSIIVSLLYQNNPDDLRFIMVDPKRVELPVYNGIPHLLTPVITEVSKTINALKWSLNEMDRRFEILAKVGKRNIDSYNSTAKEKMPYIIFIIDELADLMVAAARDIEGGIIRLAQMARAVGIHLILATQRPSVDVITGLIKANMPARIAFSVASGVDSRTILDSLGAEKLLGRGDMLFTTAALSKPKRLQGAFVSDNEIKRIVTYIKEKGGEPEYIEGVTERQKVKGIAGVGLDGSSGSDDDDELLEEAKEIIINAGKASASMLQRRLSVGYARAARLLDLLEEAGVIGPGNGAKPREVLISKEQYEGMINQGVSGVSLHKQEESVAPDEYLPDEDDDSGEEEPDEDQNDEENNSNEIEDTPIPEPAQPKKEKTIINLEDDGKYFSR